MRVLELQRVEGPEGYELAERPEPTPAGDEVLIEVRAAGIAFPELLMSKGAYQESPDLPFVAGQEIAGFVRSAPAGGDFAPGDRVWALIGRGGWAETVAAPPWRVFPLADELGFEEGAALGSNFATAVFALGRRGRLRAGEVLLVLGAGGGLGTACCSVGASMGATVIGVASTAEKAATARAAGATETVVGPPWSEEVLHLTGGRGVDVVADIVGGEETLQAVRATAPEGRVLILGFTGGAIHEVKVNRLLLRNVSVVGVGLGPFEATEPKLVSTLGAELNELVAAGLRPIVGDVYPLEEGVRALRQLDGRAARGKIVLSI